MGLRDANLAPQPAPVQEPDAIGCKCSVCGEWQRWTPSGMVCKNGHGGADGVNHRLYTASTERPVQEPVLLQCMGCERIGTQEQLSASTDCDCWLHTQPALVAAVLKANGWTK